LIELRPETFTLVQFDADEVRRIAKEAAARAGVTDAVVEIDEELPQPITAFVAGVVEGRGQIWMSGGNLEDARNPAQLHVDNAEVELTAAMLRVRDRLQPGFAAAPDESELSDRDRAAWETWAYGRCARLGLAVREQRSRYALRLFQGFTDVTDAAFERLWAADELTWDDLVKIGDDTAAVDPRPPVAANRVATRQASIKERAASG